MYFDKHDYALALSARCLTRAILDDARKGILDCEEALKLDPGAIDSRGFCHLRLADFTSALAINAKFADSFYGRGIARRKQGDVDGARADIEAAKAISPDIAVKFASYGIENAH